MNNWIEQNKKKYKRNSVRYCNVEYAIPVSALLELFSKDGEQLARDYAVAMGFKLELASGGDIMRSFIEAYNLQEVKIASLRTDLEKANDLFNSIKIPFDVDEMRSNYDRMAEENGQMLVNCANWKRELAAKDAENEALKKEVEKLQECVAVLECELFEAVNNPNYK